MTHPLEPLNMLSLGILIAAFVVLLTSALFVAVLLLARLVEYFPVSSALCAALVVAWALGRTWKRKLL